MPVLGCVGIGFFAFPDCVGALIMVEVPICHFDFYECFRNHCCYSRFYSDFCCSRFVAVAHSAFTPRLVKVVSR
jgi:hypothetical protein